ncbi:ABC transporter permease [Oharaeibacter diazotrophicus]|uniref:Spermidine/putrescine transport system permease protein n=1 Tax=Oharaeibacter diazotrophicus TaxID=1920512 RepID=A0A4V3CWG6_9HYPH|nr:ABC transporter permease [Oharaeibacter diazotrophicus]TDP86328.1 spermidine/putrescine transport system permease protein [Oharaeibacter diazotrophicus]BBE71729.1 spermidine/putrescine transport system permease protein PotB [Pleomorphomonas sp. SM30]GLS78495.1 ABC transporter permease [Oharaeibacter diazotrophicus]
MTPEAKSWRDPVLVATVAPLALIMAVFFLVPLAMTAVLTFQTTQYYRLVWSWDLKIWTEVFSKPHYWTIMARTLVMALVCVVVTLALAYPAAYALATRLKAWNTQVQILIVFAFLTDAVLKTFGWILVLDKSGVANWALDKVGFGPEAMDLLFTPTGTMIGMVYNLVVYPMFTIYLSLVRIDRDLVLAAYDAGASRLRAFVEVTLPLSRPGLYAGAVLVFVLSLGAFLEPKVLGGGTAPLASELIRQSFETRVNWPLGAALTILLIAIGALVLALGAAVAMRRPGRTGRAPA